MLRDAFEFSQGERRITEAAAARMFSERKIRFQGALGNIVPAWKPRRSLRYTLETRTTRLKDKFLSINSLPPLWVLFYEVSVIF